MKSPDRRERLQLLSCAAMAAADQATITLGVSGLELMENAGRAIADQACNMVGVPAQVLVLCGPGNNGGDGFVAARLLAERGRIVKVGLFGDRQRLSGDADVMAQRYEGGIQPFNAIELDDVDLVIDAVFGAGLNRAIDEASELGRFLRKIESRGLKILAVDVPSGLNGDSGAALGVALHVNATVTFFRRKPGHLLLPGRELCGHLTVAEIGIPDCVLSPTQQPQHGAMTWANAPGLWAGAMPGAALDQHKYSHGHTVVVSGEIDMSGAARLAARAALRIGSGLVTVAAPPSALAAHASQLNAILLSPGQDPGQLRELLSDRRKNAVVVGPGLGATDKSFDRVMMVLQSSPAGVVIDADALSCASEKTETLFPAIKARPDGNVVMTPHEGEFRRLFGEQTDNKLERTRRAAARSGAVVLLKGADTVIAAPDGRAAINENAPPWLATAGSGDVLAGMIAGLLAQHVPAFEAACAAAWLHGDAAARFGRGMIAEDIVEMLPAALQGCHRTVAQF